MQGTLYSFELLPVLGKVSGYNTGRKFLRAVHCLFLIFTTYKRVVIFGVILNSSSYVISRLKY